MNQSMISGGIAVAFSLGALIATGLASQGGASQGGSSRDLRSRGSDDMARGAPRGTPSPPSASATAFAGGWSVTSGEASVDCAGASQRKPVQAGDVVEIEVNPDGSLAVTTGGCTSQYAMDASGATLLPHQKCGLDSHGRPVESELIEGRLERHGVTLRATTTSRIRSGLPGGATLECTLGVRAELARR